MKELSVADGTMYEEAVSLMKKHRKCGGMRILRIPILPWERLYFLATALCIPAVMWKMPRIHRETAQRERLFSKRFQKVVRGSMR